MKRCVEELEWFGHMKRMGEYGMARRVLVVEVSEVQVCS